MKYIIIIVCCFVGRFGAAQGVTCKAQDRQILECILSEAKIGSWDTLEISQLTDSISKRFIGTTYVAKTLEVNTEEKLVVNVTGLDCTTFVESVMALTVIISNHKFGFDDYKKELFSIRYRNGKCEGYTSRLHYFTEWLVNNSDNGHLSNITHNLGGEPYLKKINFMSSHRSSYAGLNDRKSYTEILTIENAINKLQMHYIPKASISRIATNLRTGDIIGITTSIDGLDVVHMGFAFRKDGKVLLLHASSDHEKVMISEETLEEYLKKHRIQTGIIVARINKWR